MILSRIVKTAKTVVIFALVCAILCLSALNVAAKYRLFPGNTGYKSGDLPVEAGGSASSADTFSLSFVLPEFIGAKITEKTDFSIRGNYDKMYEVYSFLSPTLAVMFSSNFDCAPYEDTWESALSSENIIYLRYYNALPFQVLWAHFNAAVENNAAAGRAIVKEILIILEKNPGGLYTAFALTMDSEGGCMAFRPSSNAVFIDADALNGSTDLTDCGGFSFRANAKISGIAEKARLSPSQPIQEIPITTQEISLSAGDLSESLEENIALFGFGTGKAGSSTNTDGARVFWETHGTLTAGRNNNTLQYTAAIDGGISVYDYISGPDLSEEMLVYNCILSAEKLWASLSLQSEVRGGGEIHIGLTGLEYNGEELIVVFSYFFDCIPIITDLAPYAMRAVFKGGVYTGAGLYTLRVFNLIYPLRSYTDEWMLRVLTPALSIEEGTSYLSLIYEDKGDAVRAQWSLIY